jgi:hypothetical protein
MGDSMMVIKAIVHKNIAGGNVYSGVMSRTLALLKNLEELLPFSYKKRTKLECWSKGKRGD